MKVPMPLPLPLLVPAAYYYYHHHHQHLLHSSSYSSYNSCPAMPKCVAGTWIRPRVCNPMALSKAWACKASCVALQWHAEPARTGACIRPPPTAVAAMATAAAHSCHGNPATGVGSLHADLNRTGLYRTLWWWWMKGYGKGRMLNSPNHLPLSLPFPSAILRIHTVCKCHPSKARCNSREDKTPQLCSFVFTSPSNPTLPSACGVELWHWTKNCYSNPFSDQG